jgi:replicative DNA helicase
MAIQQKNRQEVEKYIISSYQDDQNIKAINESGISYVHFSPGTFRELFRLSSEYYEKYGSPLTPDVLLDQASHLSYTDQQKANLHATFKNILSVKTNISDLPYYCDKLKNFLAGDIIKDSFEKICEITKEESSDSNLKALEKLQEIISKSKSLLENESSVKIYDAEEMEVILKEEMVDRKLHPEKFRGVTTHIREIDAAFHSPLRDGELTLFMAGPGGGKTTTMLCVADAMWINDSKNILYATLEMSANRIAMKHLSASSATTFDRIENAELTEVNKSNIKRVFEERKKASEKAKFIYLEIASSGRIKTSLLESSIKSILPYQKIDVLVVDYLELLYHAEGKSSEHWIQMGDVCKFLRGIGKKYGFTVMSAVQLKREAISRIKKTKDNKADFGADDAQGSNQISGDADRIYALMIDDRHIKLFTAKNRFGSNNYECSLYFDPECSRIYSDNTDYEHEKLFTEEQFKEIIDAADNVNNVPEEKVYSSDIGDDIDKYYEKEDEDVDVDFDFS